MLKHYLSASDSSSHAEQKAMYDGNVTIFHDVLIRSLMLQRL